MKRLCKIISVFMSVLMIMGVFSVSNPVLAADINEKERITNNIEQLTTKPDDGEGLVEVLSERDRYTKVFKKTDGTKTAVVSSTPIHFETDNGWEDIDNTLIEQTNATGKAYKNHKNDFTAIIPEELSSNKKIEIEKDGYTLSFELEGTDILKNKTKVKGKKPTKEKKSSKLENGVDADFLDKTSSISFENVGENTSVEYAVTTTGIKENIILYKKPQSEVTYTYKIKAKSLQATLNKDNSVVFKNQNGLVIFVIPAPVMYDAENTYSQEIGVKFEGKNGKYTLIYTPSYEWLSGDVKYPVVVDPVIETDNDDEIADAFVYDTTPSENYGEDWYLNTIKTSSRNQSFYIDLVNNYIFESGVKIKSVLLYLYYTGGSFVDENVSIGAFTVTSDWDEGTVTYNNKPTTVSTLIDRKTFSKTTAPGYIPFDITKAYTTSADTYGVCIRQRDASTGNAELNFASSENATVSYRPYYVVEYYESQGIRDQFDYHAFDVGRAGTAYFNDFTDQIYIERDELGLAGINMPVQIKRFFNSGWGGTYSYSNAAISKVHAMYGLGWHINYSQSIEYRDDIGDKEYILYRDANGRTVYFEKTSTVSDGVRTWKEVSDIFTNDEGYTLYMPSAYDSAIEDNLQYATVKDADGQTYEFKSNGLLVKITTAEENSQNCITVSYLPNSIKIDKITDGAGRQFRFSYTTYEQSGSSLLDAIQAYTPSGNPITVKNNSGASIPYKITYTYEMSTYVGYDNVPVLSSATYPDGETVYYTLSDDEISLRNIDGYTIEFDTLSTSTLITEKVYEENGSGVTVGGALTVSDVNDYQKKFVDINNVTLIKQYDMYGRTINTKNPDGTIVARTYSEDNTANGVITYSLYNAVEYPVTYDSPNLVTNSSFNENLNGWTVSTPSKVTRTTEFDCVPGNETPGSLQIVGSRSDIRYATQTIEVNNGLSGDEYLLEYFTRNNAHSHMIIDLAYYNMIIIEARKNVDGDGTWKTVAYVEQNPFNTNWQKYSYAFDIGFDYNEIKVIIAYYLQYGTVRFDNVTLLNTYKATSSQNSDGGTNSGESGNGTDSNGGCTCDGCTTPECPCTNCSDNCTQPMCNRGYNFVSDSQGSYFTITDGVKEMGMSQTVNGNYYGSQTDINGLYTGYNYNQMNGQLNSISNGNGDVTSFGYDAMSRLNKVTNSVEGLTSGNVMETAYTYSNDRIASITHNGFSYNYEYNAWGNPTSVKVGEQPLVSYTYDTADKTRDRINRITYGNGDYTEYTYSADGNITEIKSYSAAGTLTAHYTYTFDELGVVQTIENVLEKTEVRYTENGESFYDLNNTGTTDDSEIYSVTLNNSNQTVETIGELEYSETESEITNDAQTGTTTVFTSGYFDNNVRYTYDYTSVTDYFGRNEKDKFSMLYDYTDGYDLYFGTESEYTYKSIPATDLSQPDRTTSLVESYKNSVCFDPVIFDAEYEDIPLDSRMVLNEYEYLYEYDSNGNITRIRLKTYNEDNEETVTEICSYVYDSVGQLVRENNAELNKTYVYVYDKGGNIARKVEYAYTTGAVGEPVSSVNYTYDSGWKDKLISYGNTQISTDAMGNPLNYTSKNIYGETVEGTLEWNGRQLKSVTMDVKRYEYSYNSEGLRTSVKTYINNSLESIQYYIWQNGKLEGYYIENKLSNENITVKMLYDNNDEIIGLRIFCHEKGFDDTLLFRKNIQGDIVEVYDDSANLMLSYTYDAWGNLTATVYDESNQGLIRAYMAMTYVPITYRGYMYDAYTGLYYLQSRYYNPTYGRFLNADTTEILKSTQGTPLGANLFAYCNNNPVNLVDYGGMLCVGIGIFVSAALGLATSIALMLIGDSEGNAGLFLTVGIGIGLPSLSLGISLMIDSSRTIFELRGWSFSFGGSAGAVAMIGGDVLLNSNGVSGGQIVIGGSAKLPITLFGEVHGMVNYTILLFSWKMGNSISNMIRGIYELLEFYGVSL